MIFLVTILVLTLLSIIFFICNHKFGHSFDWECLGMITTSMTIMLIIFSFLWPAKGEHVEVPVLRIIDTNNYTAVLHEEGVHCVRDLEEVYSIKNGGKLYKDVKYTMWGYETPDADLFLIK